MPRESEYFQQAEQAEEAASDAARFVSVEGDVPEVEAAPGVWMRPVFGDNLNLSLVRMEPGSVAPVHEHSEEQIGFVLEGSCDLELAGKTRTLGPGDVYHAPPFVPHGATAGNDGCRILDAFSPPREALRELLEGRSDGGPTGPSGCRRGARRARLRASRLGRPKSGDEFVPIT